MSLAVIKKAYNEDRDNFMSMVRTTDLIFHMVEYKDESLSSMPDFVRRNRLLGDVSRAYHGHIMGALTYEDGRIYGCVAFKPESLTGKFKSEDGKTNEIRTSMDGFPVKMNDHPFEFYTVTDATIDEFLEFMTGDVSKSEEFHVILG